MNRIEPAEEDEEAFPHLAKPLPSRGGGGGRGGGRGGSDGLRPNWLEAGRDFGGSRSGVATPAEERTDVEDAIEQPSRKHKKLPSLGDFGARGKGRGAGAGAGAGGERGGVEDEREWIRESGMGIGARADALGDQVEGEEEGEEGEEGGGGKGTKMVDEGVQVSEGGEEVQIWEDERRDKSFEGSVY